MITRPAHGNVNDRSLVNPERCALEVAEPQSIALSFEMRVVWGETLAPAHLRQCGPSCQGLGQMGVHTCIAQSSVSSPSWLFVDPFCRQSTKVDDKGALVSFSILKSTYSSPEAMKRIRPEEERRGGINAMFLTDSLNGEVWVIVPKERDIKQRQPRQWLCGTMAVVGHLIQGASETDLPLIYLELVYPCSWTQGAHQYHK